MPAMKLVLQWELWLYGLLAGFIAGGANACVNAFTAAAIAPTEFNLVTKVGHFLLLFFITGFVSGLIAAAAYLAKSPLPQIITTDTEKTITPLDQGGVKIVEKVTTSDKA